MIFVAVGTQKFQMNRLLEEIDNCIEGRDITEKVFAQIGNSTYHPKNYEYSTFLCKEDFEERVKECNLLITHSGVATIITGLKFDKPVIVVPRYFLTAIVRALEASQAMGRASADRRRGASPMRLR